MKKLYFILILVLIIYSCSDIDIKYIVRITDIEHYVTSDTVEMKKFHYTIYRIEPVGEPILNERAILGQEGQYNIGDTITVNR